MTQVNTTLASQGVARQQLQNRNLLTVFFLAFAGLILARMCISQNILNVFMNYTVDDRVVVEQSNIFQKLHPATWATFLFFAFIAPRIVFIDEQIRRIAIAAGFLCASIFFVCFVSYLAGRSISLGYLFDNLVVACAACVIMISFPQPMRVALGHMILTVLVINSIVALGEFSAGARIFPFPYPEVLTFRASSFFGHPLTTGFINALAVPFVWLTGWSGVRKILSVVILIAGCLAAGARLASIMTFSMALFTFLAMRRQSANAIQLKMIGLFFFLLILPIVYAVADAFGLFDRFQQVGIYDQSAESRIVILGVFKYFSTSELLFGVGVDELKKYAMSGLHVRVENAVIILIFQFGAILAFLLLGALVNLFWSLSRGAGIAIKLSLFSFLATLLVVPIGKDFIVMVIILLALAFREESIRLAGRDGDGLARG